ncbi:MAG TPA: undecaprenyl-phosphate glucose phosphotransferase [Casimicrobiaceae bacterium]|nr:undecaprenyl-phosphate glucose phosphotransferase [Casimicrobiaceae bacterium]
MNRSILKPNAPLFELLLRATDPFVTVVAGVIAYRLYLNAWELPDHYEFAILGIGGLTMIVFPMLGLYGSRRGVTAFEEVRQIVNGVSLLAVAWFVFLYFSKTGIAYSRVWSAYWFLFTLIGDLALRGVIRLCLRQLRRRGFNLRHVVIVGAGRLGATVAERLRTAPWAGFAIRGFYDDDVNLQGQIVENLPVLGPVDKLADDLEANPVDQVWITLPLRAEEQIRDVMAALQQHSLQVRFVPDIYDFNLLHHSVSEIQGLPVINLTDSPLHGRGLVAKSIEDFALAALIVLIASPVLLAIALGVKLSSPGPVFYAQQRVTWNGNRFSMLKFRSMPVDAEVEVGPVWSRPGEKRATRFGSFLRRFSLDELPQLFNVLRGEMSIVGPRPERPEFVARFKRDIPGYMQKHLVKAGITGWAQVNDLRGDTDLKQRIQYDLYYIENWSVWFDLRIIALTILHVARSKHAH